MVFDHIVSKTSHKNYLGHKMVFRYTIPKAGHKYSKLGHTLPKSDHKTQKE